MHDQRGWVDIWGHCLWFVSSEKLPPRADKHRGIYLARRSYFLLLCVGGNGSDRLIRSCHAEGRASSSNEPGVVGKAQTWHKTSCWPSVAVCLSFRDGPAVAQGNLTAVPSSWW